MIIYNAVRHNPAFNLIYLFCVLLLAACPGTDNQIEEASKNQKKDKTHTSGKPNCPVVPEGAVPTIPPEDQTLSLFQAVQANDPAKVRKLIEAGGANKDAPGAEGRTALMLAAGKGYTAVVQALIDKKANMELADREGQTALIWAAREGHTAVVQALIDKKANMELADREGQTALIWAAREGHTAVVQALINAGADVNAVDNTGWMALTGAAYNGHKETVKALITAGGIVYHLDKYGRTALKLAKLNAKTQIVQLIEQQIRTATADLLSAMKNKNTQAALAAIAGGADINVTLAIPLPKEVDGQTVLMYAAYMDQKEVVKALIAARADVNAVDNKGITALMYATISLSNSILDTIKFLIEKGADVNAKDSSGKTPLMWATSKGLADISKLKVLVKAGADVNARMKNGWTALMLAAGDYRKEIFEALVEMPGIDVNARTNNGKTALMETARRGLIDPVKLLLKKGADKEAVDKDGKTALDMATEELKTATAKVIREYVHPLNLK